MLEEPKTPKRRIWLDATEDDGRTATMDLRPLVPPVPALPLPIPPRHHSPVPSAPEPRRRNVSANQLRGRKKEREKQAAGPEVISTLIDSLSTITFPENTISTVNGASKSTPATPVVRPMRSFGGGSGSDDRSADVRAFQNSLREDLLELDDAAEPPVVRTSKRPSGYSEWTAPKTRTESPHGLRSYLKSGIVSRSVTSLVSNNGRDDDARSIGNISIEFGGRRGSVQSQKRESFESRTSTRKGHHSLLHMASREKMKPKEKERRRETLDVVPISSQDYLYSRRGSLQPPSPKRPHPFDAPIEEEAAPSPSPPPVTIINRVPERESSKRKGKKPIVEPIADQPNPAHGPTVPSRRSSLKLQDSPPSSKRHPHSRQGSAQHPHKSETVPEVDEPPSRPQTQAAELRQPSETSQTPQKEVRSDPRPSDDLFDGEDTHVTRRIKELKARKVERDKLARQSPSIELESPIGLSLTPDSSTGPSNTPPQSRWKWAQRKSDDGNSSGGKTRKFAGAAISVPPPGPLPHKDDKKQENGDLLTLLNQPTTPLTPTPLPINYSYVVNTLGGDSSPPSSKAPSSKDSITASRPKTLAVGGRSAASRKEVTKSLVVDPTARRRSQSELPFPAFDGQSDTISADKISIDSLPVVPASLPRRSSSTSKSKKNRWSHPDLPNEVERRSSMRESKYAVKAPPRPETVLEEPRPSSADSIDHDVDAFIHAPRLSQKVKHPETGRIISFSEVGDPRGHAVFCCVGMGLTRYVTAFYDELATTLKLRLITPDRPGVGESPSDNVGTPLSWPGKRASFRISYQFAYTKFR
jgi:hypothetical protein